jgi:hypothetical protein
MSPPFFYDSLLTPVEGDDLKCGSPLGCSEAPNFPMPWREGQSWADYMDEEDGSSVAGPHSEPSSPPLPTRPGGRDQATSSVYHTATRRPEGHVHNPYSLGPTIGEVLPSSPFLPLPEALLLSIIVNYMDDREFNRHHGSVAVEKVQNVVHQRHPGLLRAVLKRRSFNAFIDSHPELFHIFALDSTKKRMRYLPHVDWMAGDANARVERQMLTAHYEKALVAYLQALPQHTCTVDEFIEMYPLLPPQTETGEEEGPRPLPRRGDFVRMVRHKCNIFEFDDASHTIRLRFAVGADTGKRRAAASSRY